MKARVKAYLSEVQVELKKVSWTPRQMLKRLTIVMLILMCMLAAFFGIVDLLFTSLVNNVFIRRAF